MSSGSETAPSLYVLVDASTGLEGLCFLKRAPLVQMLVWQKIYELEGKKTLQLDHLKTDELQYLYWNSTKTPPADDHATLVKACGELAQQLELDETPEEALRSRLPAIGSGPNQKENVMGQGAATEGALEKGATKKSKKAKAAEGADGAAAPAETKEAKPKREKDPTGRPSEGTATRKVWDIADKLAADNGNVTPTRKSVIEKAVAEGVNKATAGVQYGAWFKGMKRTPAPEPEPAPAAAPAAPAAS